MNILELKKEKFPSWYFEKVKTPKDLDNYEFYYKDTSDEEDIFVENIIGTTHENYYHKAWLEMLTSLERHRNDSDTESVRRAILEDISGKSVVEYNGKYYIDLGNHRFCQAKFLGVEKLYCSVSKYKFNFEDFALYKNLKEIGFSCTYSSGNFTDIKLGNTVIYVNSKEDVLKLVSMYKSIKINILYMVLFCKKMQEKSIIFTNDKDFERDLKNAKMSYLSAKKGSQRFFMGE